MTSNAIKIHNNNWCKRLIIWMTLPELFSAHSYQIVYFYTICP